MYTISVTLHYTSSFDKAKVLLEHNAHSQLSCACQISVFVESDDENETLACDEVNLTLVGNIAVVLNS